MRSTSSHSQRGRKCHGRGGRPNVSLEDQMSKRKPAKASKHAPPRKIAAKPQRATQAIVRSPKDSRLRSVAASSTVSPPERHNDSKQEAQLVENPATALQDDCKQAITDNDSKKRFDFFFSHGERAGLSSKVAGNGTSRYAICF